MSACDIIEEWDETDFSGEGGRLDQIGDLVKETMEKYGFESVGVEAFPGFFDWRGVYAEYIPEEGKIYFDADYIAGDEITPDDAIYLAIHESIHAMDVLEDGELEVGEAQVAAFAFGMAKNETNGCTSEPPESGGGGSDTGGW